MKLISKVCLVILWFCLPVKLATAMVDTLKQRANVLDQARNLLDTRTISYVYGGHTLGDEKDCELCNQCLGDRQPKPEQRLQFCPVCSRCSLDCSHFIFRVFQNAGLPGSYLDTDTMNSLAADVLLKRYYLVDLGRRIQRALPGDLLVYEGHVVLLEKKNRDGTGDIIHVTSGKNLRGPGFGIQRERQAPLASFRGPVLRILRHSELMRELRDLSLRGKSAVKEASPVRPGPAN